jgi:hypothetical protein
MTDFLAHATLLRSHWEEGYSALKSQSELFRLIPSGYVSFLFLTLLVGWFYSILYKEKGSARNGLFFGAVFGSLFALSTFFGWYSVFNLPISFVFLASLVYFIEVAGVGFCYGYLMHTRTVKRRVWVLTIFVMSGFVISIVLQNVL